jgi:hypothetical protein
LSIPRAKKYRRLLPFFTPKEARRALRDNQQLHNPKNVRVYKGVWEFQEFGNRYVRIDASTRELEKWLKPSRFYT